MNILVLGGYGNFGARICRALAGDSRIALQVAGRDLGKAKSLANELGATACRVDSASPELSRQLRDLEVGLVIHTAGPFQAQDYSVAQAAAAAGAHYIDLADGRRFVCDFVSRMDPLFRSAGTCAVTGASTVPALSSAVVDEMLPRFEHLDSIDICIAPAQRAPRGRATLAGVLSYCGEPIQVWREGRWQAEYGWGRPREVQFARLKPRLGALCDIPDLELFPMRYAGAQHVMFRAALEVRFTQQLFAALAWLKQRGVVEGARAPRGRAASRRRHFRPARYARWWDGCSASRIEPWGATVASGMAYHCRQPSRARDPVHGGDPACAPSGSWRRPANGRTYCGWAGLIAGVRAGVRPMGHGD